MRYKKSAVSSQQIVQAAIRVLARQGYARTSLMDIAKEAGMSKGAVHYHFPTKESLIQIVLTTACDAVQLKTIDAWSKGGNPFESLRGSLYELWGARVNRTDEAVVVADLLAQSLYDETLRPQLAAYYEMAAQQIVDYLTTHLFSLGVEPRIPPPMLARIVIALMDGLSMQAFAQPDRFSPDEVVHAIEQLSMSIFLPFGTSP
jgi:AcrR family transcriptional regulator